MWPTALARVPLTLLWLYGWSGSPPGSGCSPLFHQMWRFAVALAALGALSVLLMAMPGAELRAETERD